MKKIIATATIFAILILVNPVWGASPFVLLANSPRDLRGIYVYTNDISQLTTASAAQLTTALGVSGVDGVNLVFGWDAIEPRPGMYQWDASNGLTWSNGASYVRGDEVLFGSEVYVSLNDGNMNHSPVPGRGNWSSTVTYALGDEVNFNQYTYVSLTSGNIGNQPSQGCTTDCTSWQPVWNAVGTNKNLLDEWIAAAANSHKKIALTIPAGSSIPSWLFQFGARPLDFTISPHAGATGVCQAETIAAPWDNVFLTEWDTMLAALANHLKTTFVNGESEYDAIEMLRLTGINRTTEELRLPAETPQSTGLSCISDAIAIWQAAHYKPSRLLKGWNAITDSFIKSFPDKSFSVAIIPQNPFPPIAEDGSIITGTVPDQNHPLIKSASEKLPGRLVEFFEWGHYWRDIWTDGRKLPSNPPIPRFYGYAVGRWEGDTFVVESNGYDDRSWIVADNSRRNAQKRVGGFPHSDEMQIREEYKRVNYGLLQITITITDPKVYAAPWTTTDVIALNPNSEIAEHLCVTSDAISYNDQNNLPALSSVQK